MNKFTTPDKNDWDRFWEGSQLRDTTGPSWSKRRIIKIVGPLIKKNKKALDASCGSGFFSKYFHDCGMITTSLDYSDEALEKTRQVTGGNTKIVKQDLTADDLSSQISDRFSLIFSDGLLEHFSSNEQDKILHNLKELLCDGGVIVTIVPNRWSMWEVIRPLYMPGIDETPFILSTLVSAHKKNDLEVIHSGGINVLPFAISPDKILGSRFGMLLYAIARKNA